jgi:hypothetical protein
MILAYAVGEESFIDINGNGVADAGPCVPVFVPGVGKAQQCGEFIDTPEAFRDDNFNGVRDAGETFIDFNSDGQYNLPDGIYNGLLRPSAVTGPKSKHVFYNSEIVMSTDGAIISVLPASLDLDPAAPPQSLVFIVTVTDRNGNTMASGTTVKITVPFGTATGLTDFTFPQNIGTGVDLKVNVAPADTPKFQSGFIKIEVTSPGGLVTSLFPHMSGNF